MSARNQEQEGIAEFAQRAIELNKELAKSESLDIAELGIDTTNFAEDLKRKLRDARGDSWNTLETECRTLVTSLLVKYFLNHESRKEIESVFRSNEYFRKYLWTYPKFVASQVEINGGESVELGLLAAEIAGRFDDFRDVFVSLGFLYKAALENGLSFENEVKRLESKFKYPESPLLTMRTPLLNDFLNSAYLLEIKEKEGM